MKKIILTLLIILALLVGAAVVLPVIYKDDLIKMVNKEINKNIDATVNFEDVHLSLFRSFPHFSLGIDELSVSGKGSFKGDTLAEVPGLYATVDILSVFKSGPVQVIGIKIQQPDIFVKVLRDGSANYDIVKETEGDAGEEERAESEEMLLQLKKVEIEGGRFVYDDASIPYFMELNGISHTLRGDLTATTTRLKTFTAAEKVRVVYDGVEYLSQVSAEVDTDLEVNFDKMKFTFSDNEIYINEIPLEANGWFQMEDDGYDMDIAFKTRRNRFKPFLSLIPAIYQKDFEKVEASGEFRLQGRVKGKYDDNGLPAYHVDMDVSNAAFGYPSLPDKVKDIAIAMRIDNATGNTDDVVVDISSLGFSIAGNPFEAAFLLKTPISDPYIKSKVHGNIDLANVMKVYPFAPGSVIRGEVDLDLKTEGNLSSLENENYSKFKALGYVSLDNVKYIDDAYDIAVNRGQFNFSPEYVDMTGLDLTVGESDFYASGKLVNFIGYALKNQTMQGELNVQSQNINVNAFIPEDEAEATAGEDTTAITVIEIPDNIHFNMTMTANEVTYNKVKLNDVSGRVEVKDRALILHNLKMNAMNGMMALNGSYATPENQKPWVEMAMDLKKVSVSEVAENFLVVRKLAPITSKARGDVSLKVDYTSNLKSDMFPDLESVNANGDFQLEELRLVNVNTLDKLGTMLEIQELKQAVVKDANVAFEISNGKLFVKPFDMKLNGMKATLGGETSLDQSIDYDLQVSIPRAKFGQKANKALENIVGEVSKLGVDYKIGETIPLKAKITGTLTSPKIKASLVENAEGFKEELKDKVNKEIEKKKEEARKKIAEEAERIIAEARKKGDKLIAEARKQAQKVREEGKKAAEKLRKETDKQVNSIKEKAESEGMLARMAAKKAAEKAQKEGYRKADQLENEADKRANNIVDKAEEKADKLLKEAKEKARSLKE